MAAVVRLKRHLDDEPVSALILNCKKRQKISESDDSEVSTSTVLTFAGTVNNQNDDLTPHIDKLSKDSLEISFKKHVPNITKKLRHQTKKASEDNRFKVVNFFRSANKEECSPEISTTSNQLPFTVLDVESADYNIINSAVKPIDTDFVYDIYYTNSEGIGDNELDAEFRVCPANELIFDDAFQIDSDAESDDSNAENDWRNDYPDEESDNESIDEDDMLIAIKKLSLKGEGLSSDDDDDCQAGFMYSVDSEAVGFEEDPDVSDHSRYGELYARFKRGQKRAEETYNKDLYHDELDDVDDTYYD